MPRLAILFFVVLSALNFLGQTPSPVPTSDPQAVTLAQQSVAALTGVSPTDVSGSPIGDVTLNASVVSILGSDYETGSGILRAKGSSESRVDLTLSNGIRSDVRNLTNGVPGGGWMTGAVASKPYAEHNCWGDATWFFPALSSLSQTANQNFIFKYLGQTQHNGVNAQHIQVFQVLTTYAVVQKLSATDFYLDPVSFLPVSVDFNMHSDVDVNTSIPVEINFANYQQVNGIQVPFHMERMLNGGVVLDITITSAAFNTGLPDSLFTLP